jgi:hypothetical protein
MDVLSHVSSPVIFCGLFSLVLPVLTGLLICAARRSAHSKPWNASREQVLLGGGNRMIRRRQLFFFRNRPPEAF